MLKITPFLLNLGKSTYGFAQIYHRLFYPYLSDCSSPHKITGLVSLVSFSENSRLLGFLMMNRAGQNISLAPVSKGENLVSNLDITCGSSSALMVSQGIPLRKGKRPIMGSGSTGRGDEVGDELMQVVASAIVGSTVQEENGSLFPQVQNSPVVATSDFYLGGCADELITPVVAVDDSLINPTYVPQDTNVQDGDQDMCVYGCHGDIWLNEDWTWSGGPRVSQRLENFAVEYSGNTHYSMLMSGADFTAQSSINALNQEVDFLRAENQSLKERYASALTLGSVVESLRKANNQVYQDLAWLMHSTIPLIVKRVIKSDEFLSEMSKVKEVTMEFGRQLGQCDARDLFSPSTPDESLLGYDPALSQKVEKVYSKFK